MEILMLQDRTQAGGQGGPSPAHPPCKQLARSKRDGEPLPADIDGSRLERDRGQWSSRAVSRVLLPPGSRPGACRGHTYAGGCATPAGSPR